MITATIEKQELVLRLPLHEPQISKSGKSHIVAGTGGFSFIKTGAAYKGKAVSVSVNAIIPAN